MDTERLARWLTLLANIGVIAGILILVIEIRQANQIAVAATEIEIRNAYDDINKSIYADSNLTKVILKLSDVDAELTPEEDYRMFAFVLSVMNTWMGIEVAYENGLVPKSTFDSIEDDLRSWLHDLPGLLPYFQRAYDQFPSQHESEVYRSLEKVFRE